MLASYPASILNQKTRRAGILNVIQPHQITLSHVRFQEQGP